MGLAEGWGVRGLRQRCSEYRAVLAERRDLCTIEELSDYWPGGPENRIPGSGGWIYCLGRYLAFLDRGTPRPGETDKLDAEAVRATLAAFQNTPQSVELVRDLPNGQRFLSCHPKSFRTLTLLDGIEEELRWLLERVAFLRGRWESDAPDKTGEALALVTRFELYAVWICTTEGVGSPFDPDKEWPPIPDHLVALDPLDVVSVLRAHHTVNKQRLSLIAGSLRGGGSDDRKGDWSTLIRRAASELKTPADHLLVSRSFASWFAEVALLWDERAEAHEQAQQSQPAHGPMAEALV